MNSSEKASLSNLGTGAAIELFDLELRRVLENIMDPNTKATVKREVVLKVVFKPDEDRDYSAVEIQCASKLAPMHPYPTNIFIGKERGEPIAREHNPKQLKMFPAEQPKDGVVVDMKAKGIGE